MHLRRALFGTLAGLTLVATLAAGPSPSRAAGAGGPEGLPFSSPWADRTAATVLDAAHERLAARGVKGVRFSLERIRTSPIGEHYRGRQMRGGVPVDGTWLVAWVDAGRVRRMHLAFSKAPGRPAADPISAREAATTALDGLVVEPLLEPTTEELLVERGRRLVHIWRVTVVSTEGPVEFDVRADDGKVITLRDPAAYEDTTATAFDPNPVVALKDPKLRQPGPDYFGVDADLDEQKLASALVTLPIRGVNPARYAEGRLVGPHADVQGPAPLVAGNAGFRFTRGDPRFETTMAYAHVDRLQRYFQGQLGLDTVNNESQRIYAVPTPGFDNSFYVQGSDLIVLGTGGVDDGEDAEVIVHEYGHAIHDDQVPGWGANREGGAMGEGFGDLLAAAYFARTSSGGFQDTCVADWDATSYSDADPPCLRRLDTKKKYPQDMRGQVHADGEIWSAFLWKLRDSLGSTTQDKSDNILRLVLVSHELLTPDADFKKAVAALRQSAKALGRTDWGPLIKKAAAQYGL